MKIITIIGDSLACPRPWDGIALQDTYGFQLQKLLGPEHYIVNWAARGNSTHSAVNENFIQTYIQAAKANYAIIHLGIVDCAPRLMSRFERLIGAIAAKLPLFSQLFQKYAQLKSRHRLKLTKLFPMTQVPKNIFRKNYELLLKELLKGKINKIYLINIANPGDALVKKSYGIQENIQAYNQVIAELHQKFKDKTILVDINHQTKQHQDWIESSDGHHILKPAHDWLASVISHSIRSHIVVEEYSL